MYGVSSSTRAKIIKFVKNTYNSIHKVPSIAEIVENIPDLRSVRHLYDIFPGKLEEICEAAGVPIPSAIDDRRYQNHSDLHLCLFGCRMVKIKSCSIYYTVME